jgi:hypothetical protein
MKKKACTLFRYVQNDNCCYGKSSNLRTSGSNDFTDLKLEIRQA